MDRGALLLDIDSSSAGSTTSATTKNSCSVVAVARLPALLIAKKPALLVRVFLVVVEERGKRRGD